MWTVLSGQPAAPGLSERQITGFVIDSREAGPGVCFVALPGERLDGHDFVADALQRGASAAICSHERLQAVESLGEDVNILRVAPDGAGAARPLTSGPCVLVVDDSLKALQEMAAHWRQQFSPRVIGVTGSVGKSTSKEMIAAVLRQRYPTLKNPGNLNNEIGLPLTVLQLRGTHQHAVLEMGMYDLGEVSLLASIARPQVGVVTNIGPTHLERLGSLERIAQAKAELVLSLPSDGVAVLNRDDRLVRRMADLTEARVLFYGLTAGCDLWASHIESAGLEGIRFRCHYGDDTVHVKVPLLGRHSVHTALRAAAVGLIEGLGWEEIVRGLQDVSAQLRLLAVAGIRGSTLLDDTYNASPTSTIAALNLLEDLGGRHIAVLGDMLELGSFEESGHRLVGCRAADVVQVLITVGQKAHWIGEEALACGLPEQNLHSAADNATAVALLRDIIQAGDTVLVKGSRSMGMEEIVSALTLLSAGSPGAH